MNNQTSENVKRNYKIVLSDVLFLLSHAFKTKIEIDCCQIYSMRLIFLLCQLNCRACHWVGAALGIQCPAFGYPVIIIFTGNLSLDIRQVAGSTCSVEKAVIITSLR